MVRPATHSRGGLCGESDRRPLLSSEELAEFLQVPLSTVYVWNHRRQGPPAHKVGRHLRYRWAEVETWLEDQAVEKGRVSVAVAGFGASRALPTAA